MARFRKILKNRNFFFLWLGQIISQVGDRLGFMALIGFAYSKAEQGSTAEIFKVLLFTIIPVFLIGPIAGAYVDRWDRRRTLYGADLIRMILVLIIPVFLFHIKNLGVAYFLIFVVFCVGRFFIPAKLAIVPDLVEKEDLIIANSLVNITGMIAFVIGSGISGFLVEWFGPEKAFYLDSVSFFISAALVFFISVKSNAKLGIIEIGGEIVELIKKSVIQEIKEGTVYFIKNKDIRFAAGVLFVLSSALGVVSIVSIAFIQNTLNSATKDLGLLIMFIGSGLFLGTVVYGRFGQKISQYKAIFSSLFLTGIMVILFALGINRYPYFILAAGLSFLLGFIISPILIASNTIVHQTSDNEMRGKIFSSMEIVMHLGFLAFMYISSILAERFSQVIILVVIGCVLSVLGVINFIYHRKIPWLD